MHESKITCLLLGRHGGMLGKAKGVKISLEFNFTDHPLSSGFTDSYYTDEKGEVFIEHRNTGKAWVYINGKKYNKPFTAPGNITVGWLEGS